MCLNSDRPVGHIVKDKALDKKTQIIEAAIHVIAREGLDKGKIATIAKQAGIGKGTVYGYFSSKEEIFEAIEAHITGGLLTVVKNCLDLPVSAEKKIRSIFTVSVEHLNEMGEELLIVTELIVRGARSHLRDQGDSKIANMYAEYRKLVETILVQGVEAGEFRPMNVPGIATLFLAFIDGIIWQYIFIKDASNFNLLLTEALQSFLKGIRI